MVCWVFFTVKLYVSSRAKTSIIRNSTTTIDSKIKSPARLRTTTIIHNYSLFNSIKYIPNNLLGNYFG